MVYYEHIFRGDKMGCLAYIIVLSILGFVIYGFTINAGVGILFLLVAVGVFALIFKAVNHIERAYEEKLNVTIAQIEKEFASQNFEPKQSIFSCNHYSLIAFDEDSKTICVVQSKGNNLSEDVGFIIDYYSYKDLLESQLLEDGVSTTKTSRGSQLGGALLGGILAGGVGAVIGGLSGKSTTTVGVKSIILQIVVNDTTKPILEIPFLYQDTEIEKDTEEYKQALVNATHWHKLVSVLIKQADREDSEVKGAEPVKNGDVATHSTSDEIRKLYELFQDGILTEEEFNTQKKKLIE